MTIPIFIGIDPGKGGGLAFVDAAGTLLHTARMPDTDADLLELLHTGFVEGALEGLRPRASRAVLERVSASPQMGVSSAFSFGRNFGATAMALQAAGIPFDMATPVTWQRAMGVAQQTGRRSLTETDQAGRRRAKDKNISKRRAQQLFPSAKVTHAVADALLLAEYCRRLHLGIVARPEAPKPGRRAARGDTELF